MLRGSPSTTNLDEELRGSLPRLAARPPQVSPTVVHSAQRVHGGPRFAAPGAQPPAGRAVEGPWQFAKSGVRPNAGTAARKSTLGTAPNTKEASY